MKVVAIAGSFDIIKFKLYLYTLNFLKWQKFNKFVKIFK